MHLPIDDKPKMYAYRHLSPNLLPLGIHLKLSIIHPNFDTSSPTKQARSTKHSTCDQTRRASGRVLSFRQPLLRPHKRWSPPASTLSTSLASLPPSPPLLFAPAFHSQDHRAWRFKWGGGGILKTFVQDIQDLNASTPQHRNTSGIRWSVQVQVAGTLVEVEDAVRKGR
ncbi:hypothetical protein NLI96_g10060 [Meripilus lineatus]|uniref:Uncharacterized protein n=1 Tax=Meripilus lineatus TaxID=2056292 RepID=A0AAD5Y9M2_9APHY|nr:hypothetical protein NLI96_g10060 [Physisporinus lineatus]